MISLPTSMAKPLRSFQYSSLPCLQKGVGANIEVKLIRQGKEVTVSVKVAEAPQQQQ
jgi:S1-C subfamily serine protease